MLTNLSTHKLKLIGKGSSTYITLNRNTLWPTSQAILSELLSLEVVRGWTGKNQPWSALELLNPSLIQTVWNLDDSFEPRQIMPNSNAYHCITSKVCRIDRYTISNVPYYIDTKPICNLIPYRNLERHAISYKTTNRHYNSMVPVWWDGEPWLQSLKGFLVLSKKIEW